MASANAQLPTGRTPRSPASDSTATSAFITALEYSTSTVQGSQTDHSCKCALTNPLSTKGNCMTQPRPLCHWSVTQNPNHDAQLILNTKMQPASDAEEYGGSFCV